MIPGIPANWKLVTKDLLPTVKIFIVMNFVHSNLTLFGTLDQERLIYSKKLVNS
jgi:hypothetical protein